MTKFEYAILPLLVLLHLGRAASDGFAGERMGHCLYLEVDDVFHQRQVTSCEMRISGRGQVLVRPREVDRNLLATANAKLPKLVREWPERKGHDQQEVLWDSQKIVIINRSAGEFRVMEASELWSNGGKGQSWAPAIWMAVLDQAFSVQRPWTPDVWQMSGGAALDPAGKNRVSLRSTRWRKQYGEVTLHEELMSDMKHPRKITISNVNGSVIGVMVISETAGD